MQPGSMDLVAGGDQTCVVVADEGAWCWGENDAGQLGDGTTLERRIPVPMTVLEEPPVQIALGDEHTCALARSGRMWCWGSNRYGQLGDGTAEDKAEFPQSVQAGSSTSGTGTRRIREFEDVVEIGAGHDHTCARRAGGTVWCWGHNGYGELGDGTTVHRVSPVMAQLPAAAVGLDVGDTHVCARLATGGVWCWGAHWLIGFFGDEGARWSPPVDVPALSGATSLSIGMAHVCGALPGKVVCWGDNLDGQLGDPEADCCAEKPVETHVPGLADAVQLASGFKHTCARTAGGRVACWGSLLGEEFAPRDMGFEGAVGVAAGMDHACALLLSGRILCWGEGTYGQLGNDTSGRVEAPVPLPGLPAVKEFALGYMHSCLAFADGRVECGMIGETFDQPQLANPLAIVSGTWESCALMSDHLSCVSRDFGSAFQGARVLALPAGTKSVAQGGAGICVVTKKGQVWCADEMDGGCTPPAIRIGNVPGNTKLIEGIDDAVEVAVGAVHFCARLEDGSVVCWGMNWRGQLGGQDDGKGTTLVEVGLPEGAAAVELALGYEHSCARTEDGKVRCWGSNAYGQLGNPDGGSESRDPIEVEGLAGVVEIEAGTDHTCARTGDGKVWCWGLGDFGQIGDGVATFGDRPTPSAVSGLPAAVVQLSAGSSNTCALDASGQVWCWGQLRTMPIIGKVVGSREPVEVDLAACPIGKPAAG